MNFIDDVATFLADNHIGVVGTNLFVGELPLDKSDCVSIVAGISPEPNKSIPYYEQMVDVWARYSSYDKGYQKLQDILNFLHRFENYDLANYHVYLSYGRGLIEDLDRDSERRHLFKLSLAFVYRRASEMS